MKESEAEAIKNAVFQYLSQVRDYKTVRVGEIRTYLEEVLSCDEGTFKQSQYKNYVKECAMQYVEEKDAQELRAQSQPQSKPTKHHLVAKPQSTSSSSSSTRTKAVETNGDGPSDEIEVEREMILDAIEDEKKGKFSISESKIILQELLDYSKEKGIELKELDPHYREEKRTFSDLYERLMVLLPNRSKKSLRFHAIRLIERQDDFGKFTEEDKERLKQLITIHGNDFSKIAKIMGKRRGIVLFHRLMACFTFYPLEDCKHVYQRIDKVNRGKFTVDEDNQLIEAVHSVTQSKGDIPSESISWKEVAIQLKNYRHPDDYCRRWPIILAKLKKKSVTQNSSSSSNQLRITEKDHKYTRAEALSRKEDNLLKLLRYLQDSDADDETEIVWAQVDIQLGIYQSEGLFKRAVQKHFQFEREDLLFQEIIERLIEIYERENNEAGNKYSRKQTPETRHQINHNVSVISEIPATDASNHIIHGDSNEEEFNIQFTGEEESLKEEEKAMINEEVLHDEEKSKNKKKKKKSKRKSNFSEDEGIDFQEEYEKKSKKKKKKRSDGRD